MTQSLLSACKLERLIERLKFTEHVDGDVIEVGVYRGGALKAIAEVVENQWCSQKMIYGYDTFEGLPHPTSLDIGTTLKQGVFNASMYEVAENVIFDEKNETRIFKNLKLVKGIYPETQLNAKVSFAHLDIDLYEGTFKSLVALSEVMSPGGIVVCDDYQYHETPGVEKAIKIFMLNFQDKFTMTYKGNQAFLRRNLV